MEAERDQPQLPMEFQMTNSSVSSVVSSVSSVVSAEFEFDFEAHVAAIEAVCVPTAAQVFFVTFFVAIPVVDQREINPLFLETIVIEKTFAGSLSTIFDPSYNLSRYPFIIEAQLPDRYNFAVRSYQRLPMPLNEDRKIQRIFAAEGFYKWSKADQADLRDWWDHRKIERWVEYASAHLGADPTEDDVMKLFRRYLNEHGKSDEDDVVFLF
jgi:hypothetical protein